MSVAPVLARLSATDERVCDRVRHWRPPRWLALWMIVASRLGDGWLWVMAAAALLASGPASWGTLVPLMAAVAATNVAQVAVKRRVCRPRPCARAGVPALRMAPPDRFSFPSGHAMNAFAWAVLLAPDHPELAPLFGVVAASVAASRVALGLHYPTDVVAGALLGSVIATAARLLVAGA